MASVKALMPGPGTPIGYVDSKPVTISGPWNTFLQQFHFRTGGNPYDKVDGTYQLVLGVQTDLGTASANGHFTVTDETPSAGAIATIALRVHAEGEVSPSNAQLKLSATASGGSFIEGTADEIRFIANTFKIDGTFWLNGAVITNALAANAASLPGSRSGTGTITCAAANAWTLIDSFTDTFTGRPVTIWPGIEFDNTDSADHTFTFAMTRDSTDPNTSPIFTPVGTLVAAKTPASYLLNFPIPDQPTASSHTYRAYFRALDTNTNVRARFWNINYLENKR